MTRSIRYYRGRVVFVFLAILVGLTIFVGLKGLGIYKQASVIEQKFDDLFMSMEPTFKLEEIPDTALKVKELRREVDYLYREAKPYFWLTPLSSWIPKYGGTISQAPELIKLAQYLTIASDELITIVSPKIETMIKDDQPIEVLDLLLTLEENTPQLLETQIAITQAKTIREQIDVDRLTPKYKKIFIPGVLLFLTIFSIFSLRLFFFASVAFPDKTTVNS